MDINKKQFDNRFIKLLEDERCISWQYLIPLKETSRVLIICDAINNASIVLARSVRHITIIGLSLEHISLLQVLAEKKKIKNISAVLTQNNCLPFRAGQFDIIIIFSSLSNKETDKGGLFTALKRILKLQGIIFYIGRRKSIHTRNDTVSARKCINLWKQHGWKIQNIYAFFPSYDKHKIILPLSPFFVFQSGLRMHNTLMPSTYLKKAGIISLRIIGIIEWIISGYGLVITKNGGHINGWFMEYLWKQIKNKNFHTIVHNTSYGKGSKAILKLVGQKRNTLAYIKVADNFYRGQFIELESINLNYLSNFHFKYASTPKVISFEKIKGHYILVLEGDEKRFLRNIRYMNDTTVNFLIELFNSTSSTKLLHETLFWEEFTSNFKKFERTPLIKDYFWLKSLTQDISKQMKGKYFPFGMAHRDFVGWNLKRQANGQLFVLDWEWSKNDFIPFQDFFHFIVLTKWANSRKNVSRILEETFFSRNKKYRNYLKKYCRAIDVSIEWSYYFLILYLIEWTIFHLINSIEKQKWAQETLEFLEKVKNKKVFTADKWLTG